jgi:hypothetical protein
MMRLLRQSREIRSTEGSQSWKNLKKSKSHKLGSPLSLSIDTPTYARGAVED